MATELDNISHVTWINFSLVLTWPHTSSDNDVSLLSPPLRFDIVLMREGRMKGQAFVGLPSEQSAEKALRETNGYVLYDKPLVVVSFHPISQDEKRKKVF